MAHTHSTIYACRNCGADMQLTTTPGGEPCYECINRACQFTAMVGAECSMNLKPQPEPTPPSTPAACAGGLLPIVNELCAVVSLQSVVDTTPAARKAAYHLAGGLDIRQMGTSFLVPSGTRAGLVHCVTGDTCSCEAGRSGKACWHREAVHQAMAGKVAA
jgi:hypothetical protein